MMGRTEYRLTCKICNAVKKILIYDQFVCGDYPELFGENFKRVQRAKKERCSCGAIDWDDRKNSFLVK